MAKEVLSVPEEHLAEVIKVIRSGVQTLTLRKQLSKEVRAQLLRWCVAEESYLKLK